MAMYTIEPHTFEVESDCDPEKDIQGFIDDVIDEIIHGYCGGMDFDWYRQKD